MKRGLSGVITTIILIGIALAVVGIGYFTVMNVMEKAGEDATSRSSSLTEQIYGGWKQSPTGLVTWQNDSSNIYCEGCNVGIGTTEPGAELEIANPSGSADIKLDRESAGLTDGQSLGELYWGANGNVVAMIRAEVEGTSEDAGDLVLRTTPSGGSMTDRMTISSNGNVGIGTTSPAAALHIESSIDTPALIVSTPSYGQLSYIPTSTWVDNTYLHEFKMSPNIGLKFTVNNDVEAISILSSGNVGIGTTSPAAALHVYSSEDATAYASEWSSYLPTKYEMKLENPITHGGASSSGEYTGLLLTTGRSAGVATGMIGLVETGSSGYGGSMVFQVRDNAGNYYLKERMRINDLGNVGIGTTNPNEGKMEVKGGTVCVDTNSDDSATSCIASESDERLKTNIKTIDNALDKIMKIRGVEFDWKWNDTEIADSYPLITRFKSKPHSVGIISQELEKVFPEAIMQETIGEEGYQQVDYKLLVAPLIEAVKELKSENDALKDIVCLDHPNEEICS